MYGRGGHISLVTLPFEQICAHQGLGGCVSNMVKICYVVLEEKFGIVGELSDEGRMKDGRVSRTDPVFTISSPGAFAERQQKEAVVAETYEYFFVFYKFSVTQYFLFGINCYVK